MNTQNQTSHAIADAVIREMGHLPLNAGRRDEDPCKGINTHTCDANAFECDSGTFKCGGGGSFDEDNNFSCPQRFKG